jgi:hypothetical protein
MRACCPPNRGCNAHGVDEPCVLTLFRAAAASTEEARVAVERWEMFESVERQGVGAAERRFHRRAYERARDRALTAVAMEGTPRPSPPEPPARHRRARPGPGRSPGKRRGRGSPNGAGTVKA